MQHVSAEFQDALRGTNTPLVKVMVGDTELDVIDGSVTLDASASTRGSCSLTVAVSQDDLEFGGLIPDVPSDLLAPYGNEVVISRGLMVNGVPEMVQLGIFRIDEVEVTESNDGQVQLSLTGMDRSVVLIDAVFEEAGQCAAGTNIAYALILLAVQGYPSVQFAHVVYDEPALFESTVTTPLLSWEAGDDRWDFMLGLAEAASGKELYFDSAGVLTLLALPASPPEVWQFTEGEDATLLGIGKRWSREDAYNRVVVEGESSTDVPVIGEAIDRNPASPTFYSNASGDFGKRTLVWSSEYVTKKPQADAVAERILRDHIGTHQEISFDALVNPALEPNDVVLLQRPQLGINEHHVLESVTIPLTYDGTMSCTTRRYQVTNVVPPPPPVEPPPTGTLTRLIADTPKLTDATVRTPQIGGGVVLPPAGMALKWDAVVNAVAGTSPTAPGEWDEVIDAPASSTLEYRTGYALLVAQPTESGYLHTEFQAHNTAAGHGGIVPGTPGDTCYYEWELWIPAYVEFPSSNNNVVHCNQFHGNNQSGYTGGFDLERGTDMLWVRVEGGQRINSNIYEYEHDLRVGTIQRNAWNKIGYHVRWDMRRVSDNPTGFARPYLNGLPAIDMGDAENVPTMGDYLGTIGDGPADTVMFRVGWYVPRVGPTALEMRVRNVKVYT